MNGIWKKRWIKALRSGDYEQGRGVLKRTCENIPDKFCCLGVLCEIHPSTVERPTGSGQSFFGWLSDNDLTGATLPSEMRKDLKMDEILIGNLIEMNDMQFKNFNDIADWIEENL